MLFDHPQGKEQQHNRQRPPERELHHKILHFAYQSGFGIFGNVQHPGIQASFFDRSVVGAQIANQAFDSLQIQLKINKDAHRQQRRQDEKAVDRYLHIDDWQTRCFIENELPVRRADHRERTVSDETDVDEKNTARILRGLGDVVDEPGGGG